MSQISKRIARVVDENCRGNKSAFARALNITPAFAAQLYNGQREPSDRTIADICQKFGVSRLWLETGEGDDVYVSRSLNQELTTMVAALMNDAGDSFQKRFISALLQVPPDGWDAIEEFVNKLSTAEKEPRGD